DIEPSAELPANRSERVVRDTCHWRQHHGRPDTDRANSDWHEFAPLREFHIAVDGAAVDRVHRALCYQEAGIPIASKQDERCKNMTRLYVGNLPHQTTEHELQMWVESHGFKVETVQVIKDLDTGASRGFAFVELPEVLDAQEAVIALNGQEM